MSFVIEDVLFRNDPERDSLPVVFDSPHSGVRYLPEFRFCCPLGLLRQAEDAFVEELFAAAPDHGATLLAALFPRSFIDVNRGIDDIEPDMIEGAWHGPLNPSAKAAAGMGLIRRSCRDGEPIYDGRLPGAEVARRIDRFYRPYHRQLAAIMDGHVRRFGAVWHLNCHSMPAAASVVTGADPTMQPDFVLGDRDGTTCEPEFLRIVARTLEGMGYRVAINTPFKGVELVQRYSAPELGRHSLQIEINRRLYLDEETLEKHDGFEPLRDSLTHLIRRLCDYAGLRVSARVAAE